MKKIILFASLLLCSLTQAQVITATADGATISEGQTFTVTSLDEADAKLTLIAKNVTNADIYIKLKVNSIINSDGTNLEFCFGGLCYFSIEEGDTVPANNVLTAIKPGGTNNVEDHFYNANPGIDITKDVAYNLSFIQVDAAGKELSTLLTFNYKYSPKAGLTTVSALQNMGITVNNTVVKNLLSVTARQDAKLELYNLNGQKVKTAALKSGSQSIDLSSLSAGIYVAGFTTGNRSSQLKIVKN